MANKRFFSYALILGSLLVLPVFSGSHAQNSPAAGRISNANFTLSYYGNWITALSNPEDRYHAEFLRQGGRLGDPVVKYKVANGDWLDLSAKARKLETNAEKGSLVYTDFDPDQPLKMVQRFKTDGRALD